MSFPRYATYKSSGIDWLGQLPSHWTIRKFRYLFRESAEKISDTPVGLMLSVSGYRGIEVKEYDDENRRRLDEDLVGYRIVRPGQLVVNTMWLNYGGLGVSDYEGHVSPAYRSYWIDSRLDKSFVHFLMRSSLYVQGYTRLLTGIRPNSLQMSREDLQEFPIIIPPAGEQRIVAQFLDRETSKVDALIAEQKRLIEILKEKRQAVISRAVTRGLDPKAPMKSSGIEWLGDVPQHWEELPLKALFALKHGYPFDSEKFSDSGKYVVMTPGNFHERGGFRSKATEKFYAGIDIPQGFILESGQLLVAMTEQAPGLLGSALFVPNGSFLHNQRLGLVHKLRRDRLSERYLFYLFNSHRMRAEISVSSTGAKVKHTSPQKILSVKVLLPPLSEQEQIVSFLDERIAKIDVLEAETERTIEFLEEHLNALISAAVTGQIDVRGLPEQKAA